MLGSQVRPVARKKEVITSRRGEENSTREGWENGTGHQHACVCAYQALHQIWILRFTSFFLFTPFLYSGLRALRKRTIKNPYQAISAKI